MAAVCFYFQVHQPYRIKRFTLFDIGVHDHHAVYFDDDSETDLNNKKVFRKVADKSYLPSNRLMLKLLKQHPEFKISYSLSGVFMEQAEEFYPEVIDSFKELVDTGRVEMLSETYYHSLAFLYSKKEFKKQIKKHSDTIKRLFGVVPRVFRNTELIYNDELAQEIENMGYDGILAEGADHILGDRSPNFLYKPVDTKKIKLLLKNYKLSDDIAFRFSNPSWIEHPLTVEKYGEWINSVNGNGEIINLFMDYETFGEHQWEDTGIFKFLEKLPEQILKHKDNYFLTPTEAVKKLDTHGIVDMPDYVSWADTERDLSAWRSNKMQEDALEKIFGMEDQIVRTKDDDLIHTWRKLQTSDHYYYMCTKWFADGDVHKYFNPYESPYEAYIAFMNVIQDLVLKLDDARASRDKEFIR
jgi:alpha-amylase